MTFANKIALVLFLAAAILYFKAMEDGLYLALSMLCTFLGGLFLLSKRIILKRMMNKMKYPGLLYGVCDKIGLLYNLGIYPGEEMMDDLYHPTYDTDTFLIRNSLSPVVYSVSLVSAFTAKWLRYLPVLVAFIIYIYDSKLFQPPLLAVFCLLYIVAILLTNRLRRVIDGDSHVIYRFAPEGLETPNRWIQWDNIYDCEYVHEDKFEQPRIVISLHNIVNGSRTEEMRIEELAIVPTDLLLLLLHYKNKYGYVKSEEITE